MKRKTHRAKKNGGLDDLLFTFHGRAPGAYISLSFDIKHTSIRAWAKILRQLADAIESGELKKEAEVWLRRHATQATVWPKKS